MKVLGTALCLLLPIWGAQAQTLLASTGEKSTTSASMSTIPRDKTETPI